ncbi:MAG: prephenate dehydratase [Rhodospirillaceae bacterium]|nr:prephenate dehydratase [Rhodospirillaceae bacterium]
MADPDNTISFQGVLGAYSNMACREVYPDMEPLPSAAFEDAFEAVTSGRARYAMIPIDNSVAGRVADIHHLLPGSGLYIIAEHFLRVNHQLLAVPGTDIDEITHVHSHVHALNQCRNLIRELGVQPVVHADTAGAAHDIAEAGDKTQAAISSELAGEMYGLASLRGDVEDATHNTTRFVVMAREAAPPPSETPNLITTFPFQVRNVPGSLYKVMGGFATNGVNMTKLESYVDEDFVAAQFYADVEGRPDQTSLKLALEELDFFTDEVHVLGTYPAHPFRQRRNGTK